MTGVALITGGSRRIGARLAVALAEEGFDVALHYRTWTADVATVAGEIERLGRRCLPLRAELTSQEEVEQLVVRAAADLGTLDVIVNNASMFKYDTVLDFTPPDWQDHLATNLSAPVYLARTFATKIKPHRGLVVNMLDFKVFSPNPDYFSYTASKMALAALTGPLAMALAPNIRVCGLAPGLTLPSGPQTHADFASAQAGLLSSSGSTPDQLASGLKFILNTPAFSGQILTIDGGESLLRRTRDVAYGG